MEADHLISFSLYGDKNRYLIGAIRNAELALAYMPDYKLRFYCSNQLSLDFLELLSCYENVELRIMPDDDDVNGMFWRFDALLNHERYSSIMIRDCDSRLSRREILAHADFMKSKKHFHIMKDHPTGHNRNILGGLFSCKERWGSFIPKVAKFARHTGQYGADMAFLDRFIYPILKWDSLVHDASLQSRLPFTSVVRDFPSKKLWQLNMVGAAVNENDEFVYDFDIATSFAETGENKYVCDWSQLN
jgi:hypothetical protein